MRLQTQRTPDSFTVVGYAGNKHTKGNPMDYANCDKCGTDCKRDYLEDLSTLNASVKLGDNELKTIGHLAQRNTDRMSEDQRNELYRKHNSYKEDVSEKQLPKGMSRIKKPPKIKWTKNK
jgi:hypothetical protein